MLSVNDKLLQVSDEIEQVRIGETTLLKQYRTGEYLVLERNDVDTIRRFNGVTTVNEAFQDSLISGTTPRISEFYELVHEAFEKGFLFEGDDEPIVPENRGRKWPIFCTPASALSVALLLIIGGVFAGVHANFLTLPSLSEWFLALLAINATLSISNVLAAIGLRAFGRQIYQPGIKIHGPIAFFSIDTRDAIMGGRYCEQVVALSQLAGPGLVLLLGHLTESVPLHLAGLLTLLAVSMPFGHSAAHRLLYATCRRGIFAPPNADSFMENNLLSQIIGGNKRLKEESYFVAFSTYTILWVGGVFRFSLALLDSLGDQMFIDAGALLPLALTLLITVALVTYGLRLVAANLWRLISPKLGSVESAILSGMKGKAKPPEQELITFLERITLFTEMPQRALKQIADVLSFVPAKAGTLLVREHDAGNLFFIIYRGAVEVLKEDEAGVSRTAARLDAGNVFGEIALLEECPRNSSVRALTNCEILILDKKDFDRLLVDSIGAERIKQLVQVCSFLRRNQLFNGWSSKVLIKVAGEFVFEEFSEGSKIIEEGDTNEFFYLIYEGEFEVSKNGKVIANLGSGEFCGEISLLKEAPANATVTVSRDSRALKLDKDTFLDLVDRDFVMAATLDREVARRSNMESN